jgi:hypothetical protein
MYYDCGSEFRRAMADDVWDFARTKLSLGEAINSITSITALAALAVRCLLEVNPNGPDAETRSRKAETLISSHMCIVYNAVGVPENLKNMVWEKRVEARDSPDYFFWSGYPSEPILAETAGRLMMGYEDQILSSHLLDFVSRGLLDKSDCGEFAPRLLFMLAYGDALGQVPLVVEFKRDPWRWPKVHRPIPLLIFLKNLFSKDIYDQLCQMHGGKFEKDFADAYVLFSHFVRVEDQSLFTPSGAAAALSRGVAYHTSRRLNRAAVDIFIPVIFGKNKKLSADNMSIFGWQTRTRTKYGTPETATTVADFQSFHEDMTKNGFKNPALYVQADMRTDVETPGFDSIEPELQTTRSSSKLKGSRYIAQVKGRGPETYAALARLTRKTHYLDAPVRQQIFENIMKEADEYADSDYAFGSPQMLMQKMGWWN